MAIMEVLRGEPGTRVLAGNLVERHIPECPLVYEPETLRVVPAVIVNCCVNRHKKCPTDWICMVLGVTEWMDLVKMDDPPWVWVAPTNRLVAWMEGKGRKKKEGWMLFLQRCSVFTSALEVHFLASGADSSACTRHRCTDCQGDPVLEIQHHTRAQSDSTRHTVTPNSWI